MPNNPVQIVLNTKDYFVSPDGGSFGPPKDFFENRDSEFEQHKDALLSQVKSISGEFERSGFNAGVVKVSLRREAWAKSHRPQRSLFPPDQRPCIGVSSLGELYFHVTSEGLKDMQAQISSAEVETRYRVSKKGKRYVSPSDQRSDVGSVDSIELPESSDKRKFSVEAAIQWLRDPRSAGVYLLEVFSLPPTALPRLVEEYLRSVLAHIVENAKQVGVTVETFPIEILFSDGKQQRATTSRPLAVFAVKPVVDVPERVLDLSADQHSKLLAVFDASPYVRRVLLPPVVVAARIEASSSETLLPLGIPEKEAGRSYPKVGIIDGGLGEQFSSWNIGSHQVIAPEHSQTDHGSFIGGLLVAGQQLNGPSVCAEPDGCEIYDVRILPDPAERRTFGTYYPRGIVDFIQELTNGVETARREQGVRIFNLSLNLLDPVEEDSYGIVASLLDRIADQNDVIFVIAAGNLRPGDCRSEWPGDAQAAVQALATRTATDTIRQPSESSRAIAVGALNPPGCGNRLSGAPGAYSRRGPGLRVGIKPDLAHIGGALPGGSSHTGLTSCGGNGSLISGYGTSYAAPLVAKTLAVLENRVVSPLSRELLLALLIHGCEMPSLLRDKLLIEVARQFVGFGVPKCSGDMLQTSDHEITLVFADRLQMNQELRFDFAWPQSLVNSHTGACRGEMRMTLVYGPPLNRDFGAEFVRVNLDAHLRQEEGRTFVNRVPQAFLPQDTDDARFEHELIRHGLKWWPIKAYRARFPQGKGKSSNWRLSLESLVRAGDTFPSAGVPFAVLVTIADIRKNAPVFNDLRLHLRSRNVQLADIRNATQIRIQP